MGNGVEHRLGPGLCCALCKTPRNSANGSHLQTPAAAASAHCGGKLAFYSLKVQLILAASKQLLEVLSRSPTPNAPSTQRKMKPGVSTALKIIVHHPSRQGVDDDQWCFTALGSGKDFQCYSLVHGGSFHRHQPLFKNWLPKLTDPTDTAGSKLSGRSKVARCGTG